MTGLPLVNAATLSLQAIAPVVWAAMKMSDRKDENIAVVHGVDQSVREAAEAATADAFSQRMPCFRKADNSVCCRQDLD